MIEYLEHIDKVLFLFLNSYHAPLWDHIMWFISGKFSWIPLYIVLLYFMIRREGYYKWVALASVILLITLADQVSTQLFKEVFLRYRPSHNLQIKDAVHIVNEYRGGMYGFVSSHAANAFALATFMLLIFKNKWLTSALLFWASLVSYSRIYLGVHYPADVCCGALLGIFLATGIFYFYTSIIKIYERYRA